MAGKQSIVALCLAVGTLLVAGGFAGIAFAGDLDYRYTADYQSANATHFVTNTSVESVENVTDFGSLNESQQETVRSVDNGSVTFEERSGVTGLPENVNRSNTFTHYGVLATPDSTDSTNALSAASIGVGVLGFLYGLRLLNHEGDD